MKEPTAHQSAVPVMVRENESETLLGQDGHIEIDPLSERRPLLARGVSTLSVMGTVRLTDGDVVFIPPATADPRDPLNMSSWQKNVVVVLVCSFSAIALSLLGGFGGIIAFYIPKYMNEGESYADITHLMTYPVLTMGLGNFLGMPIAVAVGRRSVFLTATAVLIVGSILCAVSTSLTTHLGARMLIGLAAGQSESVVPLIIQEIHFLHERTRALMIQQTIQVMISAVWMLCASPIAEALSPPWWYGLGAFITGCQLLVSVFFLPETKYPRHLMVMADTDTPALNPCTKRPPLDFVNFEARSWMSDLRLWVGSPEWYRARDVLEHAAQLFLFPNVIWIIALSGLTLGINITMATTYNTVLRKDPYNWPDQYISYANFGQIPIAIVCFPLLGYASDKVSQWRARHNDGMHEPESRLLLLALPVTLGVISATLYGLGASHPWQYGWFTYPATLAGYFFAFVGTNIICTTYLLDSYPTRAGPLLIVTGSCRGILSCLVSFNVARFIDHIGFDGTFILFAISTTSLGLLIIPMLIFGKQIRISTSRWTREKKVS